MPEAVEIEIAKSIDVVHVGDDFLIYITLRNKLAQPIQRVSVTYDLPKGFVIRKKAEESQSAGQPTGHRRLRDNVFRWFNFSPEQLTVFGSRRSMSWQVDILTTETYHITIPVRAGVFLQSALRADTYHLVFDIEYTFDGETHSSPARTDLIVYPSVSGVYVGAVMGGMHFPPQSSDLDTINRPNDGRQHIRTDARHGISEKSKCAVVHSG